MLLDEYVRVSRVGKRDKDKDDGGTDGKFLSPDLQSKKIRDYGKAHDHTLNPNPPEMDRSGGKMEREVLDQILDRIRSGKSDGLIVAKLNRFARTLIGGLRVIEEIEKAGGVLITADQQLDTSTPTGKLVLRLLLSVGEMELETAREEWREAQTMAIVENGQHMASHIPRGYDKRADGRLILNDDAPGIRRAFQMRGRGSALVAIRDFLRCEYPLPDGMLWQTYAVRRMFENRVYRGESILGDIRNPKAHKAIVTEVEWQAANSIPKRTVARTKRGSLLGGILRCAGCGHALSPSTGGNETKKTLYHIYRCKGTYASGKCPAPARINRDQADAYVEAAWLEQMAGVEMSGSQATAELENVQRELAELESELAEFASDVTARKALGTVAYHAAMESRSKSIDALQERLRTLSGEASAQAVNVSWADLSQDERHDVLAGSIDVVIGRQMKPGTAPDDRLLILWRGQAEADLTYPYAF
ncbi:MAG: recombinase family protein [Solirubrobacterales bacterium]